MKKAFWKNLFILLFACSGLAVISLTQSSCSQKTGCPINEDAHVKPDRKGRLPSSRGRSELFPKQMRKKVSKSRS